MTELFQENYINELYRDLPPGTIVRGDGGVADAVRYTKQTGELVSSSDHIDKAKNRINSLNNWLESNPNASTNDRELAKIIIKDLENAIND